MFAGGRKNAPSPRAGCPFAGSGSSGSVRGLGLGLGLGLGRSGPRDARSDHFAGAAVPIIIGMPPHIIIMGAPIAIIELIASQRSFMRGIIEGSIGIIFIIMPSLVISQ